ncbi:MAG: type II secretion system protein [Verrucomicrobiales bacterium]|nr:type II secretion system protein [Verrucomicrobiales bacterium]
MKTSATNRAVPYENRHRCRGITLIETLVVMAILAMLAMVVLPQLARRYRRASPVSCVYELKQISIAFRLFATDHNDRFPQRLSTNEGGTLEFDADVVAHFRVLSNELASPKLLVCPDDSMVPATNFTTLTASNISYFIGMGADEMQPRMILAGDDNLTTNNVPVGSGWLVPRTNLIVGYGKDRHGSCGNVGMSDGSAQQLTSARLEDYLRQPPNLTNRLLLP